MAAKAEKKADMRAVRVDVKALRAAVKAACAVVEKRTTTPVMAGVHIATGPSTMTLTASDYDMEISWRVDLAEAGTGDAMAIVVDAGTLDKIMAKLPADAEARLAWDGGGVAQISCGRSRFSLPVMAAAEFPLMGRYDSAVRFEMPKASLQAMIGAVGSAMSSEEARYYLNGIFLHVDEGGRLCAAATDGHRLSRWIGEAPDGAAALPDIIVGRKTVAVIDRLIDVVEDPVVSIAVGSGRIHFELGAVDLTAKLIKGTFPDYRRVIPTGNDKMLWFDPQALIAAVERVGTVADGKTRAIRLVLDGASPIPLRLECTSHERGQASEDLDGDYEGGVVEIGFNIAYLLDALRHLTANPARMSLSDGAGPALLVDCEDASRTYVLMPMRV